MRGGHREPARSRVEVELDRVRAASKLLAQAQARLQGRSLPASLEELLHEVRGWMSATGPSGTPAGSPADPDVIAIRLGDHADRTWMSLGADDMVRSGDRSELPPALLRANVADATVLVPRVMAGEGLEQHSRRAAYLWLGDGAVPVAVLALEWARAAPFSPGEVRRLDALRLLLGELAAAEQRLRDLHDAAREGERLRLAAELHDQLGQDLAYLAVELELAERRHPDDPQLAGLTGAFRRSLVGVRGTIGELRRAERTSSTHRQGG